MRRIPPYFALAFLLILAAACKDGAADGAEGGGADPRAADPSAAPTGEGAGPEGAAVDTVATPPEEPPPTASAVDTAGAVDPAAVTPERRNDRLAAAVSLPFYPGARPIPALSSEAPHDARVILMTNDACERVVRYYEQHTGLVAQTTELTDGNIYDIVIEAGADGAPLHGVQIRQTPRDIADRFAGRTSVILFRKKAD